MSQNFLSLFSQKSSISIFHFRMHESPSNFAWQILSQDIKWMVWCIGFLSQLSCQKNFLFIVSISLQTYLEYETKSRDIEGYPMIRFIRINFTCSKRVLTIQLANFCPTLRSMSSKSPFILSFFFFSILQQPKYVLIEFEEFIFRICSNSLLSALVIPFENWILNAICPIGIICWVIDVL